MKTASWFTNIPPDHIKIGISRGTPRGLPAGYRVYKTLAPGPWFNSVSPREYYRLYKAEILAPLDPDRIAAKLEELAGGRIPVLCCFERPDGKSWCHRAMLAEWLGAHLKRVVPEFGFERLPQAEHPLMPKECRQVAAPETGDDVAPYIGRTAEINGVTHRVMRADPNNPGQAIVSSVDREFSTTLQSLKRYFK